MAASSGSIGTFFAVLAAVLVLTLLSCVFWRVCAGHAQGTDERYDCARLASRWCGRRALRQTAVKREVKPPPVEEVPTPLPPPEGRAVKKRCCRGSWLGPSPFSTNRECSTWTFWKSKQKHKSPG